MPTAMGENEEKPHRERKLSTVSTDSNPPEPRMRTRSFTKYGTTHFVREYVGDKMDKQLEQLQLVKKSMPKDNSSLFRAVCEQISSVQTDHEALRILVEQILHPITQRHFNLDEDIHTSKYDRDKEIFKILADITSSRIKVYRFAAEEPDVYQAEEITPDREIEVCETTERGVYDSVYSEKIHEALAVSQAITYQALYEKVFKFSKEKIQKMIKYIRDDDDNHKNSTLDQIDLIQEGGDYRMRQMNDYKHPPPQFPYSVCKAMDPARYFNVEDSIYQKKAKDSAQAQANSRAVKFGLGAKCQARDNGKIRMAIVVGVPDFDLRRVEFDDGKRHEYKVSDLRPVPTSFTYHSMPSLMAGRGPPNMPFLPGCMPPQYHYSYVCPPQGMQMQMGGPPPLLPQSPPPPFPFSPPFMYPPQQQFFPQQSEIVPVQHPQPPLPRESESSVGASSTPSSMDNSSVFPSTPLSSKKGEESRRNREAKTRALSVELADTPAQAREKKGYTWYNPTRNQKKMEEEKRKGGRRATEGDTVGEMNRPLQPKQLRLSTCGSVPENVSAALPSLMDGPTQQMQQLQLQNEEAAAAEAAKRAKLPSLLPLPQQAQYTSSEWTGSDTVFKDGEGSNSQLNISTNPDASFLSSVAVPQYPPPENLYARNDVATLDVPFFPFDPDSLWSTVNKNADYSRDENGSDLPDTPTVRFFYNLGLCHFRKNNLMDSEIQPPLPQDVPMPPHFVPNSPAMQANSPAIFQYGYHQFAHSVAPPNTPMPLTAPPVGLMQNPVYAQYAYPAVEGMHGWPGYQYIQTNPSGQQMEQGSMPSPSPQTTSGSGQVFFPNQ